MKKNTLIIIIILAITYSCAKAPNPFLVEKHNIGLLTDSTQVKDLEAIFSKDSIVKSIAGDEFTGAINSIEIFEKNGTKLLDVSPKEALDSTSVVSSVRIIDERYKTEKNISTLSTFKTIKDNYKISKIDNLINSVVVSVDEINASFTIDKEELPASMRLNMDLAIDAIQIPDEAKIKYFIIHW
ncbi:MAG: hypothetical protein ACPGUH_07400 [Winogradskyella sp.]